MNDEDRKHLDRLVRTLQSSPTNQWFAADEEAMQWANGVLQKSDLTPVQRFVEWVLARPGAPATMIMSHEIGAALGLLHDRSGGIPIFVESLVADHYSPAELRKLAAEFESSPPLETATDVLRALLAELENSSISASTASHKRRNAICERARELLEQASPEPSLAEIVRRMLQFHVQWDEPECATQWGEVCMQARELAGPGISTSPKAGVICSQCQVRHSR